MGIFLEEIRASHLFWEHLPRYSVCPVVSETTPEALFRRVSGHKEFRYRVSRLKKQLGAHFEAFTGDEDLDQWADQFCLCHVERWAGTATPSVYRDPPRRAFLAGCLKAWQADGILVRFSVRVGEDRIGFVIGLLQENTLVHHSTTFQPAFRKYSPGIALIHFMAQWMTTRGLNCLDFGDGDEAYKYTLANEEHELGRIFIAGRRQLLFILKVKLIKRLKSTLKAYEYYRKRVKPHLPRLF